MIIIIRKKDIIHIYGRYHILINSIINVYIKFNAEKGF